MIGPHETKGATEQHPSVRIENAGWRDMPMQARARQAALQVSWRHVDRAQDGRGPPAIPPE